MGLLGKVLEKVAPGRRAKDTGHSQAGEPDQVPDALAEAMRGPSGPGAMPPGALADGVGVAGIDPSLLQDEDGGPVPPPQSAVADADQEVDDHLARLARLRRLRDAGSLTPAEFAEQERRILDG